MKGNKKVLVLAVLLLLLSVCFTTYAIYRSAGTGTGTVKAAKWSVKIDDDDLDEATFDFTGADINWTKLTGYNNTIAPGSEGYIEVEVDATGSEVDVILTAALGQATLPTGMTVSLASATQTINYNASSMTATVRINVVWEGADTDQPSKDDTDLSAQGSTLSIPVTLTAKQSLTSHA